MAHSLTPKVRGIRESVKATIIQDMVNTKNKINSLSLDEDAQPYFDVRDGLRDELIRLSEKAITDLNDDPRLDEIVQRLDEAASEAKRTADSLKDLSRRIDDFTQMLTRIEGIVGGIIDIAA